MNKPTKEVFALMAKLSKDHGVCVRWNRETQKIEAFWPMKSGNWVVTKTQPSAQ